MLRSMGAAPSSRPRSRATSCFETHRSAARLVEPPYSFGAAMLLGMRPTERVARCTADRSKLGAVRALEAELRARLLRGRHLIAEPLDQALDLGDLLRVV